MEYRRLRRNEIARLKEIDRSEAKLYISATPSRSTVDFYLRLGAKPAEEIDPELFALEPEDIHLELEV